MNFLKPLDQHEKEKWAEIHARSPKNGTGIACPQCGDELVESDPGKLLLSDPPRKSIHCRVCKFNGSITA